MKTQRFTLLALGLSFLVFGSGCTSLQTVSVTQIPKDRSKPVQVEENNTAFLGIHFDNDFVDEIPAQLQEQCRGGKVTGILTKYETTWYVIIQTRTVTATGYCVRGDRATKVSATASVRRKTL